MDRGQVGHRRPTGTQWRGVLGFSLVFTDLAASSLSYGRRESSMDFCCINAVVDSLIVRRFSPCGELLA